MRAISNWAWLLFAVIVACGGSTNSNAFYSDAGNPGSGGGTGSGGTGPGTGGSGGAVTPSEACSGAAAALCERVQTCAPFLMTLVFGDMATCKSVYEVACGGSLSAGRTAATASSVRQCSLDFASQACADLFSHTPPPSCRPTGGPVGNGMGCGDDWQCSSGRCSVAADMTCGVCVDRRAATGACTSDEDCDYGLVCSNKVCVTPGNVGASCDANHPCKYPNGCKTVDGGTQGTCGPTVGAGQPCASQSDCDSFRGLFCNAQTKLCQTTTAAHAGEQCGLVGGTFVFCAGTGGRCAVPAGAVMGTCPAVAGPGVACDTSIPCQPGVKCINSVCTVPNPSSCP